MNGRFVIVCFLVLVILLLVEESGTQRNRKRGRIRSKEISPQKALLVKRNQRKNRNRQNRFLKQVERRIVQGRPIFTQKAMRLIEKGGWKNDFFKLPHQKLDKAFGFCDIPREFDVKNMFPGLFRSEADIRGLPEMDVRHKKPHRKWRATASMTIEVPSEVEHKPTRVKLDNDSLVRVENHNDSTTIHIPTGQASGGKPPREVMGFICECCKVSRYFQAFSDITIDNRTYKVINLPNERQFFATEKCPETNRCHFGGCIQRYTTHHILIWNETKPYYPALDFAPLEVPTHCEWANIGTA